MLSLSFNAVGAGTIWIIGPGVAIETETMATNAVVAVPSDTIHYPMANAFPAAVLGAARGITPSTAVVIQRNDAPKPETLSACSATLRLRGRLSS